MSNVWYTSDLHLGHDRVAELRGMTTEQRREKNEWKRRALTAEATLGRVRELHKPEPCNCHGGTCEVDVPRCNECMDDWPCDTARLCYTTEELA